MLAERLAAKYRNHRLHGDLQQEARLAEFIGGDATRIAGAMKDALRKSAVVRWPRKRDADGKRYTERLEIVAMEDAPEIAASPATVQKPPASRISRRSFPTRTQRRVLELLAAGKARKIIAFELGIKLITVDAHLLALYRGLGCHDSISAIREARRRGILRVPGDAGERLASAERKLRELESELRQLREELT